MSARRQFAYFWQRHVLRRKTLRVDNLPLGLVMEVYAADDVGRRLFKYRVHEAHLLGWIETLPAPAQGALALDVGANIGWYSLVFNRLAGKDLQIHAFEPDPDNRALLEKNIRLNQAGQVTVSGFALGDMSGTATLHRYRDINRGKHSLVPLAGAVNHIAVSVDTLDAYLERTGLADADIWLLKLDVEGFEPAVVRGAVASLARVHAVILEYSPMFHEREHAKAMLEQLWSHGLRPCWLEEGRWTPVTLPQLLACKHQSDTVWCRD